MSRFDDEHCSRWPGIPQDRISDRNRLHIEILARAFRTGVYNLPVSWKKVDWDYGVTGTSFSIGDGGRLATYDFDVLTRLVILAHDECVRVAIEPHTFRRLKINMWSGRKREGGVGERHPTMEQAIESLREWRPIETAPKDGTAFQAKIPGHGSDNIIMWTDGLLNAEESECSSWCFVEDQEPPDCWTDGVCWSENELGEPSIQPTHWKPLPEATR